MGKYESCGTLRYRIDKCNGSPNHQVYFTPDTEHSIKHDEKNYVIFVSRNCQYLERDALMQSGKELLLAIESELANTAKFAAWKNIKVCITVKKLDQPSKNGCKDGENKNCQDECCTKCKTGLLVVGIAIPAK